MGTNFAKLVCTHAQHGDTDCTLGYSVQPPRTVSLVLIGIPYDAIDCSDLFEGMIAIRKVLERQGWMVLCNAARFNAMPSAMSREMGGAKMLYLHSPEVRPTRQDSVFIFSPVERETAATVADQMENHQSWLASLVLLSS